MKTIPPSAEAFLKENPDFVLTETLDVQSRGFNVELRNGSKIASIYLDELLILTKVKLPKFLIHPSTFKRMVRIVKAK